MCIEPGQSMWLVVCYWYPSLSSSLNELSEQFELEAKEGSDGEMKVWDMKQLGLQATSRIIAAKDPLKQLSEISSNFPMFDRLHRWLLDQW